MSASRRFRRQQASAAPRTLDAERARLRARASEGARVIANVAARVFDAPELDPGDELTPEQRVQVERTSRGLCSGCGQALDAHPPPRMRCPDGSGRELSFAYDRESRRRTIERLDELARRFDEGARQRSKLSDDARALLDAIAETVGLSSARVLDLAAQDVKGQLPNAPLGPPTSGPALALRLGWTEQRVKLASIELAELGYIESRAGVFS